MRKKIADKMAAASRNNAAPVLSVLLERVPLERVDLVADDAGYLHLCSPCGESGWSIAATCGQRRARHHRANGAPAADLPGRGLCRMHISSMQFAPQEHFVYDQSMNVEQHPDEAVSRIAAAIGEPARARMLYCLADGHARTSTELAIVAGVSPSTASVHLSRLKTERLVKVVVQGKHRYYSLEGPNVAAALEGLSVLAGGSRDKFVPNTPSRLRAGRTCYDHIAGTLGVSLHDRFQALKWLSADSSDGDNAYDPTPDGAKA